MYGFLKTMVAVLVALLVAAPCEVRADKKKKYPQKTAYSAPEPDKLPLPALQSKVIQTPPEARIGNHWDNVAREGIDVSHYQGMIDWQAVAGSGNIGYAYMKATEGESLVDDTYRYNIEEARKVGLKVGSYHYYRPNADMDMQFENLTSQILSDEQDLAIIIDVETRGRKSVDVFVRDLRNFLERVEKHYNSKPLIYTFQNFYNKYMSGEFNDYSLMIAKYNEDEPELDDGHGFCIWQYTSKGEIDGIEGYVDRSMVMPDFSVSDMAFGE